MIGDLCNDKLKTGSIIKWQLAGNSNNNNETKTTTTRRYTEGETDRERGKERERNKQSNKNSSAVGSGLLPGPDVIQFGPPCPATDWVNIYASFTHQHRGNC